jgi:hypothetical protein
MTNDDLSARLDDPAEHFPYKREHVDALIAENPPAGPNGDGDRSASLRDFISPAIAECSDLYIQAQAAWLRMPTSENSASLRAAAEDLEEARARHRANRAGLNVVAIPGAE